MNKLISIKTQTPPASYTGTKFVDSKFKNVSVSIPGFSFDLLIAEWGNRAHFAEPFVEIEFDGIPKRYTLTQLKNKLRK